MGSVGKGLTEHATNLDELRQSIEQLWRRLNEVHAASHTGVTVLECQACGLRHLE